MGGDVVLIAALLAVTGVPVVLGGECLTFSKIEEDATTVHCSTMCADYKRKISDTDVVVKGTGLYSRDSDACLAAVHAGAIDERGGDFVFSRTNDAEGMNLHGSTRNRILSDNAKLYQLEMVYNVRTIPQNITAIDPNDDVLIVHDSYKDKRTLHLTCLSQGTTELLKEKNIRAWNYQPFEPEVTGSGHALTTSPGGHRYNTHAVRCLGKTAITDVFAAIQFPDSDYQSPIPTARFSKGQHLSVPISRKTSIVTDYVKVKSFPGETTNISTPLDLGNAKAHHVGLYNVGDEKSLGKKGAYFDVIVRDCEDGKYGIECNEDCPVCHHRGQCHARSGKCVCPPGYYGDTCLHACPPGRFGKECQLRCVEEDLHFSPQEEGKCIGLTFCVPAPFGCTCAPGYTTDTEKPGSICNKDCSEGTYGLGCMKTCSHCKTCDVITGACKCDGESCPDRLPQPEINIESQDRGLMRGLLLKDKRTQRIYNGDTVYFITYKILTFLSCQTSPEKQQEKLLIPKTLPVSIPDLKPFAVYQLCLEVSSEEGRSPMKCMNATTNEAVTSRNLSTFECHDHGQVKCSAMATGTCHDNHGNNTRLFFTLKTHIQCNNSDIILTEESTIREDTNTGEVTFSGVIGGQNYTATVQIGNDAGKGSKKITFHQTSARNPPPAADLKAVVLSRNQVRLFWNDPCPAHGHISTYQITEKLRSVGRHSVDEYCSETQAYDRCYTVSDLTYHQRYEFSVAAKNINTDYGIEAPISILLIVTKPEPPERIETVRKQTSVQVTMVHPPLNPGGSLRNCSVNVKEISSTCDFRPINFTSTNCQFAGLDKGHTYIAEVSCCNSEFCGEILTQNVSTLPVPTTFSKSPELVEVTKSTIILSLPSLNKDSDGDVKLAVVVEHLNIGQSSDIPNIKEEAIRLLEEKEKQIPSNQWHIGTRRRRSSARQLDDPCTKRVYIAALLSQNFDGKFEVGDGKDYGGFKNCKLVEEDNYRISFLSRTNLEGEKAYSMTSLGGDVKVFPYVPRKALIPTLVVLFIILFAIIAGVIVYKIRYGNASAGIIKGSPGGSRESERDRADQESLDFYLEDGMQMNQRPCIYQNVAVAPCREEPIYENLNRRILRSNMENFMNRIISAIDTKNEFMSVPFVIEGKSTNAGQIPSNKKKNRYRNNLPYDETRVRLSIINDDPSSDYINASHVQGYGHMRYIATQGPKDTNVNTMSDFWRMIVEQDISAIIMVANFVEAARSKVGYYFKPGGTLDIDGTIVTVLHKEEMHNFTFSHIQVFKNDRYHNLVHYHYTAWPDHGVPNEVDTLAAMVRHFLTNHNNGGLVAHCSAGIGRTGTILMVLLMKEMLEVEGSTDPREVLARLRHSRVRLVDSIEQYNLALQVVDELLFGMATAIKKDEFQNKLSGLLSEVASSYKKAKSLPSNHTFIYANHKSLQHMNRNKSVLPPDSTCFLLYDDNEEMESMYFNAVRIRGLNLKDGIFVTEHPLQSTLLKFWQFVIQRKCPAVFLINDYTRESQDQYPNLLPNVGESFTAYGRTVCHQDTQLYGSSFLQSTVTITDESGDTREMPIYQVRGWHPGNSSPPTAHNLVSLAELVLESSKSFTTRSPLLSCSDGFTGCGLVAASALLLYDLNTKQTVDVYRVVVKLLRSRHQFIISTDQFALLYEVASIMIANSSFYANIG